MADPDSIPSILDGPKLTRMSAEPEVSPQHLWCGNLKVITQVLKCNSNVPLCSNTPQRALKTAGISCTIGGFLNLSVFYNTFILQLKTLIYNSFICKIRIRAFHCKSFEVLNSTADLQEILATPLLPMEPHATNHHSSDP